MTGFWQSGSGLARFFLTIFAVFTIWTIDTVATGQETPIWREAGAIFARSCVICHSGKDAPLDLQLDSYAGFRKGSYNGRIAIEGKPEQSEIIRRLKGLSTPSMPLIGDPLSDNEIALLERWIAEGMPEGSAPSENVASTQENATKPQGPLTFARIEPIFLKNCAVCHSDNSKLAAPPEGLLLDKYTNIVRGGERLALIAGNPGASEIVRRIEGRASPRMPYKMPPLDDEEIRLIRDWITQGALDATGQAAASPAGRKVRYRGRMTGALEIDGIPFLFSGTQDELPQKGEMAEMRGIIQGDGTIRATRLRAR